MDWVEPITNRTQTDVDEVKKLLAIHFADRTEEQTARLKENLKGSFNLSDMIRIEGNIQYLSDALELNLTTYCSNLPEYPTYAYFNRMRSNLKKIRSARAIHKTTPSVPSQPINTYKKLNNIELILKDVYDIYKSNYKNYALESDYELYAGQEIGKLL